MFVAYGVNEDGSLQHVRVNLGPHLHRKYPIPCEEGLVLLLVSHAPDQTPPTDPDLKVFRVRLVEVVRATGGTGWTAVDLTQKPVFVVGKPEELDLDWDTSLETGRTLLITNEGFDCSTRKRVWDLGTGEHLATFNMPTGSKMEPFYMVQFDTTKVCFLWSETLEEDSGRWGYNMAALDFDATKGEDKEPTWMVTNRLFECLQKDLYNRSLSVTFSVNKWGLFTMATDLRTKPHTSRGILRSFSDFSVLASWTLDPILETCEQGLPVLGWDHPIATFRSKNKDGRYTMDLLDCSTGIMGSRTVEGHFHSWGSKGMALIKNVTRLEGGKYELELVYQQIISVGKKVSARGRRFDLL